MESAIGKEKAMKKWLRKWKLATIEKTNPDWHDLWPEIIGSVIPAPDKTIRGQATGTQPLAVIPAHAGIQQDKDASGSLNPLDSRLRGNDGALGGAR